MQCAGQSAAGVGGAGAAAWDLIDLGPVEMSSAEDIHSVCVGHVTHDRIDGRVVAGGCALYAARGLQALGAPSRLVGAVGEDFAADAALAGLDCRLERAGRTTVFTNRYPPGAPRLQYVEQVAPSVRPELLAPAERGCAVAFLGPVLGEVDLAAWKRALRPRLLAIGVQGFVRAVGPSGAGGAPAGAGRVVPHPWQPAPELLAGVDVACLSEEDLAGQPDLLERLCAAVPLVALTRERRGCDLIQGGRRRWVGIHPARVVDPTGAGDSFAAGLLFGLASGQEPVAAARLGAAAASIIIESEAGSGFERLAEAFERAAGVPA